MGNLYISVRAMLEYLKVDVVLAPSSSRRTLTLGAKYGPEFACLPLKLNLGNFIEAHSLGADTIIMAGGCGPCRFGYYAQVEHAILQDLGYNFQLLILEPPERHISELLVKIRRVSGNRSWWQVGQALRFGYLKARAVDEVEAAAFKARPREAVPGSSDRARREALNVIDRASSFQSLADAADEARIIMANVAVEEDRPVVRVGIVGEIYTLLEPFANLNLEAHLGRMGAEVDRAIYMSEWVNDHLFLGLLKGMRSRKEACAAAPPYLRHVVGGHGQETVGSAVNYARAGYDGLVQVLPFTCMPEIIAESILPVVSADFNLPVLTLVMDEHTGEAGMITRLEAFVDLLWRKKKQRELESEGVSGY